MKKNVEKQRKTILTILKKENKTVTELAETMSLSYDTVRNRINEMLIERYPIRIAGWHILETTMVRIWGYGTGPNEPRPIKVQLRAPRRRKAIPENGCSRPKFRREAIDDWLFRIKALA